MNEKMKLKKQTTRIFNKNKIDNKNRGEIQHLLSKTDTLEGLAVRYNMKAEDIKKANKITSSAAIFSHKYLVIPPSPEGR